MDAARLAVEAKGSEIRRLKEDGVGGFELKSHVEELLALKAAFQAASGMTWEEANPRSKGGGKTHREGDQKKRKRDGGRKVVLKKDAGAQDAPNRKRGERSYTRKLSLGRWNPLRGLVDVLVGRGSFLKTMGVQRRDADVLFPEEALYLSEVRGIQIEGPAAAEGAALSNKDLHALCAERGMPWAQYRMFCWLKRRNLVAARHNLVPGLRGVPRDIGVDDALRPWHTQRPGGGAGVPMDGYERAGFTKKSSGKPALVAVPFKYGEPVPLAALKKLADAADGGAVAGRVATSAAVVATDGTVVSFKIGRGDIEAADEGPVQKRKKRPRRGRRAAAR